MKEIDRYGRTDRYDKRRITLASKGIMEGKLLAKHNSKGVMVLHLQRRNSLCFCDSGLSYKKCCERAFIPKEETLEERRDRLEKEHKNNG